MRKNQLIQSTFICKSHLKKSHVSKAPTEVKLSEVEREDPHLDE